MILISDVMKTFTSYLLGPTRDFAQVRNLKQLSSLRGTDPDHIRDSSALRVEDTVMSLACVIALLGLNEKKKQDVKVNLRS
jgi:hypothetical protein